MCGIYLTNLPLKEEELKLKVKRISHRGPDFTGLFNKMVYHLDIPVYQFLI